MPAGSRSGERARSSERLRRLAAGASRPLSRSRCTSARIELRGSGKRKPRLLLSVHAARRGRRAISPTSSRTSPVPRRRACRRDRPCRARVAAAFRVLGERATRGSRPDPALRARAAPSISRPGDGSRLAAGARFLRLLTAAGCFSTSERLCRRRRDRTRGFAKSSQIPRGESSAAAPGDAWGTNRRNQGVARTGIVQFQGTAFSQEESG